MEYVDEYAQIARDYNINHIRRLQYLHKILRGDAKRFYLDRIDGYATTYQQAIDMINNEYNSPVRQTRVKNYLNSLRLRTFESKGIETSIALSQLYKIITKFSRQAPKPHQGDAHKIEFLRNAIVGYPWSHEPLSRVPTHKLTFQMVYGKLEAALQLFKEAKLAMRRDTAETGYQGSHNDPSNVFYQGQAKYLRDVSAFRRGRDRGSQGKQKKTFNPLSIQGCFNCESPDHVLKHCPHPLNIAKAATRKVDYYSKKDKGRTYTVRQVLADLCMQLDDSHLADDNDDTDRTDAEVFQSLLSTEVTEEVAIPKVDEPAEPETEIYLINYQHANVYEKEFLGACIDSAAQKTVIGKPQAEIYSNLFGIPFSLEKSEVRPNFCFGTHRHKGLGRIEIRVPISNDYYIPVMTEVVNIDIPFLLGLDKMTDNDIVLDTNRQTLSSSTDGWKVSLVRKRGHLYYDWEIRVLFTEAELHKVHNHFFHPKPEKLYALIRRTDPATASPKVLHDLERIEATCHPCQRHATSPHRFKVSLPSGDIVFNREVCMGLMFLNQRPVLHVVDRDTKFNSARFLQNETAETAWNTFREMWVSMYVGYPDIISADQGPQFRSKYWRSVTKLAGIVLKLSGVESHNAINVGETYHEFLRRIFNKAIADNHQLSHEDLLVLSTKALNDTAGPNGLVPTLLVFGVLPRIPFAPAELPTQVQRMKAMVAARSEMSTLVARSKLKLALKSNALGAASTFQDIMIGSEVLVYREKPIKGWIGPFTVLDVNGKACFLEVNGRQAKYSVDKVKLYHKPSEIDNRVIAMKETIPVAVDGNSTSDDPEYAFDPSTQAEQESQRHMGETAPPDSWQSPLDDENVLIRWKDIVTDLKDDEPQKDIQDLDELRLDTSLPEDWLVDGAEINITKVLARNDSRGGGPAFDIAKAKEVEGINKREIWEIISRDGVPNDAIVLGGRFVLAYKNYGTPEETETARYVAQGHKDKEKGFVVHNVTTLRASSTRILVSVAAIKGFKIFADDVRQAYLQNEHELTRDIYLLPKACDRKCFDLGENEILKLKKPIYGVPDAGDYWNVTIHDHLKKDLKLVPLVGDPALYLKPNDEDLDGLMAVYVDDKAIAGNDEMRKLTEGTLKRFESKPREWDEFNFFGMHLKSLDGSVFSVSQTDYISKLKPIPVDCSFDYFRSYRAMVAWIGLTRPDMAFIINQAAQVTETKFSVESIRDLNKGIKALKGSDDRCLVYHPLQKERSILECMQTLRLPTMKTCLRRWVSLSCSAIAVIHAIFWIMLVRSVNRFSDLCSEKKSTHWRKVSTELTC